MRAAAFVGEGRQNTVGDLVTNTTMSNFDYLECINKYRIEAKKRENWARADRRGCCLAALSPKSIPVDLEIVFKVNGGSRARAGRSSSTGASRNEFDDGLEIDRAASDVTFIERRQPTIALGDKT